MLCTQILNGLASSLKAVSLDPGKDFEIVAVSFDPKDTPEIAGSKKQMYMRRYGRQGTANGWHLLTGDQANITALMETIGYRYKYDAATDQFAHASGIMVLTPEGRLSRYFYGVEYSPRDVRLGLVEASQNKIGTAVDQILLFCYHYDPATGKYGAVVMNLVRFAGAVSRWYAACFCSFSCGATCAVTGTFSGGLDSSRWVNFNYFRNRHPRWLQRWITCSISCSRSPYSSRC